SNETGSNIAAECGRQLKKVSLEMGGKNAVIVMDDADLDLAAEGVIWSAFGTSGQRCTACSRVIVHENVKEELGAKIIQKRTGLRNRDGLHEDVKLGPILKQAGIAKIKKYIQIGQEEGAKLLAGGKDLTGGDHANGLYFEPTVFTDATMD